MEDLKVVLQTFCICSFLNWCIICYICKKKNYVFGDWRNFLIRKKSLSTLTAKPQITNPQIKKNDWFPQIANPQVSTFTGGPQI
jgi:hypothetical protein